MHIFQIVKDETFNSRQWSINNWSNPVRFPFKWLHHNPYHRSEASEEEAIDKVFPATMMHHQTKAMLLSSSDSKTQEEDESIVDMVEPVQYRVEIMCTEPN